MQCVSNMRPDVLLETSHKKRADYTTSSPSSGNNVINQSDAIASAGAPTGYSTSTAFDWGNRTVGDVILSRTNSKSISSPSVLGMQLMMSPATRGPHTPPDVMALPSRLFYDSVQLSNMSPPRADDVAPVSLVRHDSLDASMESSQMAALKASKKLQEADPNQDVEKAEIDEFLRVHCLRIAQGCRDVPVKELRHIIPILILRCFCMKGEQAQKKVKGLWERAPQGWPADVPYCDPNNAPLRSRTGEPIGTKPKKETLNLMFDFLIREYLAQNYDQSVNRFMDLAAAAKYINGGEPSTPIGALDQHGHVTSSWPMASSSVRISQPVVAALPSSTYWQQQATPSVVRSHHMLHPSMSTTYPPLSPHITNTVSPVVTMSPLSHVSSSSQAQAAAVQRIAARKRPYEEVSSVNHWPLSVSEVDSTRRLSNTSYDNASSPCSDGSSSSKGSIRDHMPPLVDCRDLAALAAAAAIRRGMPCHDTAVPVFSPPSPPCSDDANSVLPSTTSSLLAGPSQPATSQPMTKKARLLAAVIPLMSPTQSEASDSGSNSGTPVPAVLLAEDDKQQLPAKPSPSQPINEQALTDVMKRIADKINSIELRRLASERFGIILLIKDLLWKMRALLDISQYLAYLEKLHELDCTLDAIGMLGVFPDSHFNRWQEFEDKWYIRVCGQTNRTSSNISDTPTSFAQN